MQIDNSYIYQKLNVLFDGDPTRIFNLLEQTEKYLNWVQKNKGSLRKEFLITENANIFYRNVQKNHTGLNLSTNPRCFKMFVQVFLTKFIYVNKLKFNKTAILAFKEFEFGHKN